MNTGDEQVADALAEKRAAAESQLWRQMEERGMTQQGGWRVAQFTRESRRGRELVLRPMHLWHESPYDLEYVLWIGSGDGLIEPSAAPEPMQRGGRTPL